MPYAERGIPRKTEYGDFETVSHPVKPRTQGMGPPEMRFARRNVESAKPTSARVITAMSKIFGMRLFVGDCIVNECFKFLVAFWVLHLLSI